jgi:CubicO group peptidase (beta-lactamase class C family)
VSGQSYEAALKKNILEPAMLNDTGYLLPDWSSHTLAIGYSERNHVEEMSTWAEDGPYWNLRGNGGLLATAADLLKWHDVLSGESVLKASSSETMQGRHVDQHFGSDEAYDSKGFYGYGWVAVDKPTGVLRWHNGGNGFFYAFFGRQIEEDLVIIGLSNEGENELDSLCENVRHAIV